MFFLSEIAESRAEDFSEDSASFRTRALEVLRARSLEARRTYVDHRSLLNRHLFLSSPTLAAALSSAAFVPGGQQAVLAAGAVALVIYGNLSAPMDFLRSTFSLMDSQRELKRSHPELYYELVEQVKLERRGGAVS